MKTISPKHPLCFLFSLIFLSGMLGCHSEEHHSEALPKLLVTAALKTDTTISKEYVSSIHSIQHIEIRALERGYLQKIFVDEGQKVEKDQPMFQIRPVLYEAELNKAKAEANFANIEYKNTKLLADKKVVSKNELAMAKAKLDKASAELAAAQVHLNQTQIKAPFNGYMDRLHVQLGSLVDEGELLTLLADNSKMWVYFNVTEAEYLDYKSLAKEGDKAIVKLIMANNQLFGYDGTVETIQADFNNETGNIAFRATFPNPDRLLRNGETGKVVMTTPIKDALIIPQKATFDILDKKFVFVVDEEDTIRSRQITIAEEMPYVYVVKEGLKAGEKILLEGLRKVKAGDEIEVDYRDPKDVIAKLELPAE